MSDNLNVGECPVCKTQPMLGGFWQVVHNMKYEPESMHCPLNKEFTQEQWKKITDAYEEAFENGRWCGKEGY